MNAGVRLGFMFVIGICVLFGGGETALSQPTGAVPYSRYVWTEDTEQASRKAKDYANTKTIDGLAEAATDGMIHLGGTLAIVGHVYQGTIKIHDFLDVAIDHTRHFQSIEIKISFF